MQLDRLRRQSNRLERPSCLMFSRLKRARELCLAGSRRGLLPEKQAPARLLFYITLAVLMFASSASVFSPKTFRMIIAAGQKPVNDC